MSEYNLMVKTDDEVSIDDDSPKCLKCMVLKLTTNKRKELQKLKKLAKGTLYFFTLVFTSF